jgi:hypothetical protein
MRELATRRIPLKTKARKAQQPSYDPYSSYGLDDSRGWIGPLPVKVVSVLDLTEDVHWSGIQRGMRVLDLGCGVGDVSLWIANSICRTRRWKRLSTIRLRCAALSVSAVAGGENVRRATW